MARIFKTSAKDKNRSPKLLTFGQLNVWVCFDAPITFGLTLEQANGDVFTLDLTEGETMALRQAIEGAPRPRIRRRAGSSA